MSGFSFDRCSCGRLNIHGATCVCESEPRHDGAVGDARKRAMADHCAHGDAATAPVPDDDPPRNLLTEGERNALVAAREMYDGAVDALTDLLADHGALGYGGAVRVDAQVVAGIILVAGYVSPEAHAAAVAEAERATAERIARAILDRRVVCPNHHMPDCSPLLNGCSVPNWLHDEREHAARIAREAVSE